MQMLKLRLVLAALLAATVLGGCNRSESGKKGPAVRDIEGQAFIVTETRDNVKLGLLGVYVADQQAGSKLLNELRGQISLELKRQREMAFDRFKFEAEFNSFKSALDDWGKGPKFVADPIEKLAEKWDDRYVSECNSIIKSYEPRFPEESSDEEFLRSISKRISDGLDQLRRKDDGVTLLTTDADGRFSTTLEGGRNFIFAQSELTIGDSEKFHLWFHIISPDSKQFLANTDLIKSTGELYERLATIGDWDLLDSDGDATEISPAARNLISKCNGELLQERVLLTSRSLEKKQAEENRLLILEQERILEEEKNEKMRIAEAEEKRVKSESDAANKIELFSERLERLKKLKVTDPDKLLGFVELMPAHQLSGRGRRSEPLSEDDDYIEPTINSLGFRLSRTEKGKPHEKRDVLQKILDRLNRNLGRFGEEPLNNDQFLSVIKAGIPVHVLVESKLKCGTCFGDGKLGRIENFKKCPNCRGLGSSETTTLYKVTWK
jgi:hypothetical protein